MPAHTAWGAVGIRLKSSGKPISGLDWRANALVDNAAKIDAETQKSKLAEVARCTGTIIHSHAICTGTAGC